MMKNTTITVEGIDIKLLIQKGGDFISMTDIARKFGEPRIMVQNWMRARGTLDFLGVWEVLNNPNFKRIEFDAFKIESGSNAFTMSPQKWIEGTNAVGILSRRGRHESGTFAHQDIALEFCSWLSPVFKLYFIKEFQRLKTDESTRLGLDWNLKRQIAKANWHIHTEAVREHLVPIIDWNTRREAYAQASEADLLNLSLFGMTSREWKAANPDLSGNLRDHASTEQLLVLSNLQSLNAKLLEWDSPKEQRLEILNKTAREQMDILVNTRAIANINQLTEGGQGLLNS